MRTRSGVLEAWSRGFSEKSEFDALALQSVSAPEVRFPSQGFHLEAALHNLFPRNLPAFAGSICELQMEIAWPTRSINCTNESFAWDSSTSTLKWVGLVFFFSGQTSEKDQPICLTFEEYGHREAALDFASSCVKR